MHAFEETNKLLTPTSERQAGWSKYSPSIDYSPGHKYTATHIFTHNCITSTSWALLFEYVMRKALLHTPHVLTFSFFGLVA